MPREHTLLVHPRVDHPLQHRCFTSPPFALGCLVEGGGGRTHHHVPTQADQSTLIYPVRGCTRLSLPDGHGASTTAKGTVHMTHPAVVASRDTETKSFASGCDGIYLLARPSRSRRASRVTGSNDNVPPRRPRERTLQHLNPLKKPRRRPRWPHHKQQPSSAGHSSPN